MFLLKLIRFYESVFKTVYEVLSIIFITYLFWLDEREDFKVLASPIVTQQYGHFSFNFIEKQTLTLIHTK